MSYNSQIVSCNEARPAEPAAVICVFRLPERPESSPPRRSYLDRSDEERSWRLRLLRLRAENDALIEEGAAFRTRMAAAVDRFEGLERTFLQTEAERRELAAELADAKRKLGDELADARYELVNARSPPRSPRTPASGASPSRGSRSSPARQTQQHESSTQTLQEATTARVAAASDLAAGTAASAPHSCHGYWLVRPRWGPAWPPHGLAGRVWRR